MADKKYLDGAGVAQVWAATKDYVAAHGTVSAAADSLLGDASAAQWATRTSTGSGAARVESVQGAAEVRDGELVPVRIAGISSVGFNQWDEVAEDGYISDTTGKNIGSNTAYLRSKNYIPCIASTEYYWRGDNAGKVMFYDAGKGYISHVGTPSAGNTFTTPSDAAYMRFWCNYPGDYHHDICINISDPALNGQYKPYTTDGVEWPAQTLRAAGSVRDELTAGELVTRVGERAYQSGDESDATVRTDGTTTYYPLATPATTTISPALTMTYKVERGGTESIVVPEGEASAAPVLTVAEGESAAGLVMAALAAIAAPDGPTATANHAANTYLTMQGRLYKVTRAIAVGEQVTSGTNVTETTVMAELLALAN